MPTYYDQLIHAESGYPNKTYPLRALQNNQQQRREVPQEVKCQHCGHKFGVNGVNQSECPMCSTLQLNGAPA
jgi:predicted Zn-ribbon and HTH transcriptional regulator